jgi:hypothetical protein
MCVKIKKYYVIVNFGLLCIYILFLSCNASENRDDNSSRQLGKQINSQDRDTTSEFMSFLMAFPEKKLPFELKVYSKDWIDFNSSSIKEISRHNAIRFLLNNDSAGIRQSDGGISQFYYGYKIKFGTRLWGVIYYRTNKDYDGFVLSICNTSGAIVDQLFITGIKGEYEPLEQKQSIISADSIKIETIVVKNKVDYEGNPFSVKLIRQNYFMNALGKIVLNKDERIDALAVCDKTNNDRIEIYR